MTIKLETDIGRILLAGLYVLVFLVAGTMSCVGQGVTTGQSAYSGQSESSAQEYCVQMGYLYQITPTLEAGICLCQFQPRRAHNKLLGCMGPYPSSMRPKAEDD
jgi:hypothetical protein